MGSAVAETARGFKLRTAGFQDFEQIIELQARFGLGVRGREDWTQMWLGNPLYRELQATWPIGWVLEDKSGRIVASIGHMPLPYEWDRERIVASSGISWVAEPAYRSASLLLLDMAVNQPQVDLYLNSTVTREAIEAIEAFQCLRVPVGLWDERAFWVTNHRGFSESLLIKKAFRSSRLFSYPLAVASFLNDQFRRKNRLRRAISVQECGSFDTRFEIFWHELRRQRRNQLLGVRSREVLNWHFGDSLRNRRLWIGAIVVGSQLIAYAIFDRRDNLKYRLTRVRLVDYQSLDGTDELLEPLLTWGIDRCRKTGIHMLENVGRWLEDGEIVAATAPYRRKLYAWSYFYKAREAGLAARLEFASSWTPSLFDGNASL